MEKINEAVAPAEKQPDLSNKAIASEIYRLQAEICRTLADPIRLEIIENLKNGERTVSELVAAMGLRQANVSQHLAVLRQAGLVLTRRQATTVYYRLSYPEITEACRITRQILMEQLSQGSRLVAVSND
ncbi:MAG: transcriptional regulator, ArsR family [Chloroflexi bacterium]|jgi:DNA-binding transcriptional ArsR family regulator|nr:transcriptional regulator, ArsR family [Chloroflexota bacterium]